MQPLIVFLKSYQQVRFTSLSSYWKEQRGKLGGNHLLKEQEIWARHKGVGWALIRGTILLSCLKHVGLKGHFKCTKDPSWNISPTLFFSLKHCKKPKVGNVLLCRTQNTRWGTWYFVTIKSVCFSNYTIRRVNRKAPDWEKIFAIRIVFKWRGTKTREEFLQINTKKEDKSSCKNGQTT